MRGIVPGASFFFATSPSRVRERIAAHGLCDIDTGASCNHDYTRPTPSGADRFPTVRACPDTGAGSAAGWCVEAVARRLVEAVALVEHVAHGVQQILGD